MARKVKPYTVIPLAKLDYVRLCIRAELKKLEEATGERYAIRTFFCGPRPKRTRAGSRPASTLKSAATAAKIGVYKVVKQKHTWQGEVYREFEYRMLDRYI